MKYPSNLNEIRKVGTPGHYVLYSRGEYEVQ